MVSRISKQLKTELAAKGLKWCPKCETPLPYASFSICVSKKDGHVVYCKPCQAARMREMWGGKWTERFEYKFTTTYEGAIGLERIK